MTGNRLPNLNEFLDFSQLPATTPTSTRSVGCDSAFYKMLGHDNQYSVNGSNIRNAHDLSMLSPSFVPSPMENLGFTPQSFEKTFWTPSFRENSRNQNQIDGHPKVQTPNILSINVLFEFEDTPFARKSVTWDDLEISLQVIEQKSVKTGPELSNFSGAQYYSYEDPCTLHENSQCTIISEGGTSNEVLQQSIDIPLDSKLQEASLDLFQLNLVFKEKRETEDWCVNASCYIGLQSARRVLYPVRCSFSNVLVDSTGKTPTFYCSFCVKRAPKHEDAEAPGSANYLFHNKPTQQEIKQDLDDEDNEKYDIEDVQPVEPSSLVQSSSHGMRPIGPNGRLMTRLQRATFLSIRKKFASQSSRDWKKSLMDSDLYPLFTLGRDECAREMGTCSTWLKVRMRERGIKVWPNRKLIHSTGALYRLKQQLSDVCRRMDENHSQQDELKKWEIEQQIAQVRGLRLRIVQESCTPAFFEKFRTTAPETVLDPDWEN